MPARRRDPVSVPRTFHSTSRPIHHSHDYGIDESISRAGFFSNAVLDDTDAAAAYSRAKDYDLLRNTHSAIRHDSPDLGSVRASRPTTRYQSLPPADRKSPSSRSSLSSSLTSSALAPHSSMSHLRSTLQVPPPSSLLSTKINTFLKGNDLTLGVRPSTSSLVSYKSYLNSAVPPPPSPKHDSRSIVSYKSHLTDPAITSPFSTRSSSRLYRGFVPSSSSSLPSYRFKSNSGSISNLPSYNISLTGAEDQEEDYDYGGSDGSDDEEEYEPPSYRRKYKILHGRQALPPSRASSTLYYRSSSPTYSDDDEYDDYSLVSDDRGMYSYNPRPYDVSPLALSSHEGPHDGSYEADMADMYDYVPFGPSRQGILELTQHRPTSSSIVEDLGSDDEDYYGVDSSTSHLPSPSSSTLLTFPSASSYSSTSIPSTSFYSPKPSSDLTSTSYNPLSSLANDSMFDSVLSNTAARARAALRDNQQLSDYRNASLVLSVEGNAVSADGKNRYGFRYYPPPIALKGSGVGLDERILGVTPKPSTSPADSFFGDYLNRLKSLRSEINDREESRAASAGADSSYGRSVVSVPRPLPSYSHSTVHMPVHIAGRSHSVPVSSYRSHADDRGLSHRVDVFPLVESSTTLGKDRIQLPLHHGDASKLTMLEKINIKAASETHSTPRAAVASRRARATSVPPKVQGRPARLQQQLVNRPKVAPSVIFMSTPPIASPNPARHASTPVAQQTEVPWRVRASSVQPEVRARRAGSMPPRPLSFHQGFYEPEPQQPLGTEGLRAHRGPGVIRRMRAGSVPPPRPQSVHMGDSLPSPRLVRAGSVSSLRPRAYQPVEKQSLGTEGLRASRPSPLSRAQSVSRVSPRKPLDFGIDEAELEKTLCKYKARPEDKKPVRGFASRATSEPPRFIPPSSTYPSIADVQEKPRRRQLFPRRGHVSPCVPPRSFQMPPVYVPPSSVGKAAIIGSKMESEDGGKAKRKPRPLYHVEKSREPSAGSSHQSAIYNGVPMHSAGLQSSRPPLPKQTDRKAIRTVDGFTKPKNVMSWEHRIESRVSPDDLIYQPQSVSRLRDQLRGAHDKLDRHRQLLDRYLDQKPVTSDASTKNSRQRSLSPPPGKQVLPPKKTLPIYRPAPPAIYVPPQKMSFPKMTPLPQVSISLAPRRPIKRAMSVESMESNSSSSSSVKIPDYYYAGTDPNNPPMSDLRRRLRRTLNKTKNNA